MQSPVKGDEQDDLMLQTVSGRLACLGIVYITHL